MSIALNQGCQIKALGPEFHKTFYIFQRLQSLHNFQKMWKRNFTLFTIVFSYYVRFTYFIFPTDKDPPHRSCFFTIYCKNKQKRKKYSSFTGLTHLRLKWAVFGPQCKMSLTAMLTNAFYTSLLTFDFIILYQVLTIICHPHRGIY